MKSAYLLMAFLLSCVIFAQGAADHVNPFIGTGEAGNCYPGAQAPFGMISWSPNTTFEDYTDYEARPGYKYYRDEIYGFTVTHISGVGCFAAQDLPIMPVTGTLGESPVSNNDTYASKFSHDKEHASPGFYEALLDDYNTGVTITVTERAGIAEFSFPAGTEKHILFRPTNSANGIADAHFKINPEARTLEGSLRSGGFCTRNPEDFDYVLYYAAEFNTDISGTGIWKGEAKYTGETEAAGDTIAAWVSFAEELSAPVLMKIGLSYVSVENARENLHAEIPHWDNNEVRKQTRRIWDDYLGRAQLQGSDEQKTVFYTALYHNLLQPSIFNDVNGEYIGFDDKIYTIEEGREKYVNFSNWDTYRTSIQLQSLLYPEHASDMIHSMLLDVQQEAPAGFPIWGYYNNETYIMNGYSGIPLAMNAYAFGAEIYEPELMLEKLQWAADNKYNRGSEYINYGYVPDYESQWNYCCSMTAEYAIADFGISQYAAARGEEEIAAKYRARSQNILTLVNPATGYLQPMDTLGNFVEPFSPVQEEGFNEGNSSHYTWSVPHNIEGLVKKIGGEEEVDQRLDDFFSKILIEGWNTEEPYFWLANEPCFGVPYVYNWIGKPWKSQKLIKDIMANFNGTPDGLPGDDDVGAMSAYFLFSALGLYPAIPGTGGFVVTGPIYPEVTLHLPGGKTVVIEAPGVSAAKPYIGGLKINGKEYESLWLPVSLLRESEKTVITFTMVEEPNTDWCSTLEARPPSFNSQ